MGVAIDGSDAWWPQAAGPAVLPAFSPYQSQPAQYIEVFNRGAAPFDYRIVPAQRWLTVDHPGCRVHEQVRATLRVDWSRAPKGRTTVPIEVSGPGGATDTVSSFIYRVYRDRSNVGYGTALAMFYLVLIIVFLTVLLRVTRHWTRSVND